MIKLIVYILSIPFWVVKFLLFLFLSLVIILGLGIGIIFSLSSVKKIEETVSNLWNYFFYTIED